MKNYPLIIDGKEMQAVSGECYRPINPANNQEIAGVASAGLEDVDLAVAAARGAFDNGPWRRMTARARGDVLHKLAGLIRENIDEIAVCETENVGKPISSSRGEIGAGAYTFEYYAGAITKFFGETIPVSGDGIDMTLREPVGVVAAIVPWNFPFCIACWKCAPALAAGNSVILKPATCSTLSAYHLVRLAKEAGVPDGVFNLLTGHGGVIGDALSTHEDIDKISFTGSTQIGTRILEKSAKGIKRVSLELGGKSPNIIYADADVERAARESVMAVFDNCGQDCCARSRMFVEAEVHDVFVNAFVDQLGKVKIGDPMDEDTEIGPMVSMAQRESVMNYIEIGKSEGGKLIGGGIPEGAAFDNGAYIIPAIFTGMTNAMRTSQEEIFGPVVNIIPFTDEATMIKEVNDSVYGLSGSIWTRDISKALRTAKAVRSGNLSINTNSSVFVEAPFGGFKRSGTGRDLGMNALLNVTEVKNIFIHIED